MLTKKKTKKPYDVKRIDQDMVVNWKAVHNMMQVNNVTKNVDGEKVNWKSIFETTGITWLRYEKERPQTILYKHDTYSTLLASKKLILFLEQIRKSMLFLVLKIFHVHMMDRSQFHIRNIRI